MLIELTDNNFTDNLNIVNNTQNIKLIIGYTTTCPRSINLINNLISNGILVGGVKLNSNNMFVRRVAIKENLRQINMPLLLIYKNNTYIENIPNTLSIEQIKQKMN
jgi:hypothetical protein